MRFVLLSLAALAVLAVACGGDDDPAPTQSPPPDENVTFSMQSNAYPDGTSSPDRHTCEGADDMPGHVKASLLGCSLTVPIHDGRPRLGTWQGICLCEHRRRAGGRHIVVTVQGEGVQGQRTLSCFPDKDLRQKIDTPAG